MPRGAVFHGINGNILFRCAVDKFYKTMRFVRSEKVKPGREITVGLEHTVHISQLYQILFGCQFMLVNLLICSKKNIKKC